MHLINAHTLALEDFVDDEIPPYATLSHRWQREEMTFQEMQSGGGRNKAGFDKVRRTCEQAVADEIEYVWIDTCCIDKSSSAELSEAINSMFTWYYNCLRCYVYLFDVDALADLGSSVWFTRGFTLQEMIAPPRLDIYGSDWRLIGSSKHDSLEWYLSKISNVPVSAFHDVSYDSFSIAQRMSWAANRHTTRKEDRAYSLMGLFGVNMPLLYGEGDKAFRRLQEEIIKQSDDQTIFAWSMPDEMPRGMLAPSPECFKDCGEVKIADTDFYRQPYSMTNKGLSIELNMIECLPGIFIAALAVDVIVPFSLTYTFRLCIFLLSDENSGTYFRVKVKGKDMILSGGDWRVLNSGSIQGPFGHIDNIRPRQASFINQIPQLWGPFHVGSRTNTTSRKIISKQVDENILQSRPSLNPAVDWWLQSKSPVYVMHMRRVDPWIATGSFWAREDMEIMTSSICEIDRPIATAPGRQEAAMMLIALKSEPTRPSESKPSRLFRGIGSSMVESASRVIVTFGIVSDNFRIGVPACRITATARGHSPATLDQIAIQRIPTVMELNALRPDTFTAIGTDALSDLWVMKDHRHVFMQMSFKDGVTSWDIDILYASPRSHKCSDCSNTLTELRFQCIECGSYLTCQHCLQNAASPHREKEVEQGSKHQFRALWPSGQDHWDTVLAMRDTRVLRMTAAPVVLP